MSGPGNFYAPGKLADSFRMGKTPFDPRTGKFLHFNDESTVQELTIISVGDEGDNANDVLVCKDSKGKTLYVAKPYMLQRTPFDGLTVDGVAYAYSTNYARTANDGSDSAVEEISPAYVFDGTERILAARIDFPAMSVGPRKVRWVDLNSCGRNWSRPQLPPYPSTAGVYWLKLTVDSDGVGTLEWGETIDECP